MNTRHTAPSVVASRGAELAARFALLLEAMPESVSAEEVHRLRTTIRRLEVALGPRRGGPRLARELRRLRRAAGRVRDLDVQQALLKTIHSEAAGSAKARLVARLGHRRQKRAEGLRKLLRKELANDLTARLQRAAVQENVPHHAAESSQMHGSSARRQYLALTAQPPADDAALHRLRIDCKRLRYALEPLAPAEAAHAANQQQLTAHRLVEQFKRVQDAIGLWHDWATLRDDLIQRARARSDAALAAILRRRTRLHESKARSVVRELRDEFARHAIKRSPTTAAGSRERQSLAG